MPQRAARPPSALLLLAAAAAGQEAREPLLPGVERLEPLVLTLDEALAVALASNLELEVEEVRTAVARYDALATWGAFDPVLSLSAEYRDEEFEGASQLAGGVVVETSTIDVASSLDVPLVTGGSFGVSWSRSNTRTTNEFALFDTSTTDVVTVALVQPLLRGAWPQFATTDQREAELAWARQEARLDGVRQQVLLDVYDAYWDLVGAVEELGVRELALELGRDQLGRARRRLEVGVGTEVDLLQAQTNVARAEEERVSAESSLRAAEDALRALLFQARDGVLEGAREWDRPILAATPLPEAAGERPAPDWIPSLELALANRPLLRDERLGIEIGEARLVSARSSRLPGLDLELSAQGTGFDPEPDEAFHTAGTFEFPTLVAGLRFDVPIPNRTARYAERAARSSVVAARLAYHQAELAVLADVRRAVRDLVFAAQSVEAARTSSEFARRQLEAEEARFAEGLATTFQVLEFQQDLAEALSAYTTARAAYAKALAGLRHAEGVLEAEPRVLSPER